MQADEIDIHYARNHKELDSMIHDPKTQKSFHPGVTVAVAEVLGRVSVKNGFWAMRKTNAGKWAPIKL